MIEMTTGWRCCGYQMRKIFDCWKKISCFGKKKMMMMKSCVRALCIERKKSCRSGNNFWKAQYTGKNWTGKGSSKNSLTPMCIRLNFCWNSCVKGKCNLKMNYIGRRLICWTASKERLNSSRNTMKMCFGWDSWGLKMNC